jgi:26S proteasome regulatory subunit N11
MNFGGLESLLGGLGQGGMGAGKPKESIPDSSETIIVSSLALLKMLKHGRAGVPMEVMGLMLGSFIGNSSIFLIN